MNRKPTDSHRLRTRRTTLTLPYDALTEAQRIARKRNVSLSSVIAEALGAGLRSQKAAEQSEAVLNSYRKAFSGFSDEEMSILDGVILERQPAPADD